MQLSALLSQSCTLFSHKAHYCFKNICTVVPENKFPCSKTSSVSELHVCDGTPDCENGSDEPPTCMSGMHT